MSVPCSVVTVRGAARRRRAATWRASGRRDTPPLRAARRSGRARCRAAAPPRPARSCSPARAGTAARGTAGTAAPRQARTTGRARRARHRNGGSLLMRCTWWPRTRERVRQLGRDHAAAADRRVADHADIHGACFSRSGRWTGSRTTMPSANATPASAPNCASRLSIELPERRRRQTRRAPRRRRRARTGCGSSRALPACGRSAPRRRRRTTAPRCR